MGIPMTDENVSKRRGKTFSFRIKEELRKRLEQAAEENERSLMQEIAFRIELSFQREKWMQE